MITSELGYHHDHPRRALPWWVHRAIDVALGGAVTVAFAAYYFFL